METEGEEKRGQRSSWFGVSSSGCGAHSPAASLERRHLPVRVFLLLRRTCQNRARGLDALASTAAQRAGDLSTFKEIFSSSPSVSIDVAVMEKAKRVLTIPCACGWSDLGSWEAVFEFRGGASGRDVVEGDAASEGGSGNLVLAAARPVRVVGLSGVAVVESPDGLLVMKLGASDDLRRAVEKGLK